MAPQNSDRTSETDSELLLCCMDTSHSLHVWQFQSSIGPTSGADPTTSAHDALAGGFIHAASLSLPVDVAAGMAAESVITVTSQDGNPVGGIQTVRERVNQDTSSEQQGYPSFIFPWTSREGVRRLLVVAGGTLYSLQLHSLVSPSLMFSGVGILAPPCSEQP